MPDERAKIMQGLLDTKEGTRGLPVDNVMTTSVDCTICGSTGTPQEPKLIVNRMELKFKTKCCGVSGSPVNFLMITRSINEQKALKILKGII